jgi:hypothetical protein
MLAAVKFWTRFGNLAYEFRGLRFYARQDGYFHSKNPGGVLLHREIWSANHGEIPDGYDVHHADDDKSNNDPGNFECRPKPDHCRHHMRSPERLAKSAESIKIAIERAAEKRRANPQWSREISSIACAASIEAKLNEPLQTFQCAHCGRDYEVKPSSRKRGFCSMSCQGMARKASGIDDEDRICAECGVAFRANRYIRKDCCSRRCSGVVAARKRLQHHG